MIARKFMHTAVVGVVLQVFLYSHGWAQAVSTASPPQESSATTNQHFPIVPIAQYLATGSTTAIISLNSSEKDLAKAIRTLSLKEVNEKQAGEFARAIKKAQKLHPRTVKAAKGGSWVALMASGAFLIFDEFSQDANKALVLNPDEAGDQLIQQHADSVQ